MGFTLGVFHDTVRGIINRGTIFNQDIIRQTEFAVALLERNCSYRYMRDLIPVTTTQGSNEVTYDSTGKVKSVKFFRLILAGEYYYLEKGDPKDFSDFESAQPEKYMVLEDKKFILNCLPDQNYSAEILLYLYTTWPQTALGSFSSSTYTHWLLDNALDLLLAQTLIYLAPIVRSPKLAVEYKPLRDEALRTTVLADEEWDQTDGAHAMGIYVG